MTDSIKLIRNFGFIAHIDAGKTTTTERVLFFSGKTHKIGEVHEGQSHMDSLEEERARGITIQSAATNAEWNGFKLNIIDTPGHSDFGVEVERSLRILDGAVCVFCSVGGVEPQSEKVWRQADKYGVPRICFVNKMDREGANLDAAIDNMEKKLGAKAVALQVPIGVSSDFKGVVDLVDMRAYLYEDKPSAMGAKCVVQEVPIPEDMLEEVKAAREKMLDILSEFNDELAMLFLEDEEIDPCFLRGVIRDATLSLRFNPVLCGSSLKDKGVQMLLNAVNDYLPSPLDIGEFQGFHPKTGEPEVRRTTDEAFSALAFKSIADQVGILTFLRIYSGTLHQGDIMINAATGNKERVGRLYLMHSDEREPVEEAGPGSIVAVVGAKNVNTGDTLCEKDNLIVYESIEFADPVINLSIKAQNTRDNDKLGKLLAKIHHEDPSFRCHTDEKTGEVIMGGMGELHLEVIVNRIQRDAKIPVEVGTPTVHYKQALTGTADIEARHIKQSGGKGQRGIVRVRFSQDSEAKPLIFEDEIKGGVIKKEYIPAVERGIFENMLEGGSDKIEFTGLKAVLYDGEQHAVDSSEMAFKLAGRLALEKASQKMKRILLEPTMKFEVVCPEDCVGDVNGDLNRRRALIENMDISGPTRTIQGKVPMAEMFGYQTNLMSLTSGRGFFSLEADGYSAVPINIAEKIYEEKRKALKEEKK